MTERHGFNQDIDGFLSEGLPIRIKKKERYCPECFQPYELIDCELVKTCKCIEGVCPHCGAFGCRPGDH